MARLMQYAPGAVIITKTSSEDMSSAAGKAVKLDAAGTVGIADTAGSDLVIGICVDGGAASGDPVSVCVQGACKALAGEGVNEWAALTCEAGGDLIATTTPGDYLAGSALEAAAADGDYIWILVGGGHARYAATS